MNLAQYPEKEKNILTTVGQMLKDRGYRFNQHYEQLRSQLESDNDAAREFYQNQEPLFQVQHEQTKKIIYVYVSKKEKLSIETVRVYGKQHFEQNPSGTQSAPVARSETLRSNDSDTNVGVIIIAKDVTSSAYSTINIEKRFEVFSEIELFRNITHHSLYMKHRALNAYERKSILAEFRVESNKLQQIRKSDPVVRYFGWCVGDIIEITQCYGNNQQSKKNYRVVVESTDRKICKS